jgi:hypothetical protein
MAGFQSLALPENEQSFRSELVDAQLRSGVDENGNRFEYRLVVQLPVPFFDANYNLLGDFILPALARTGIPQAITWIMANASELFDAIVIDAMRLIRAIPEVTISIQVRIGAVTVINVLLVAEKVPVEVPIPDFVLALPNLAVGLDIDLGALLPIPPPLIVHVPVPYPLIRKPFIGPTGGDVSVRGQVGFSGSGGGVVPKIASSGDSGGKAVKPQSSSGSVAKPAPSVSQVRLPVI